MNINSIIQTIDLFKPNDELIEVRSFSNKTKSGYFKNKENLIKHLKQNQNETWYFVLNSIKEDCYSREQNEKIVTLFKKEQKTTADKDVYKQDWFFIDVDPERTTGVSSTDEEKAKSKEVALKIYDFLDKQGFSYPIVADSGNGYHLLYKIQLNNTEENVNIIKNCLLYLDMLFSNQFAKIDLKVFNPARITKLYGTIAMKGANTSERPYRESKIIKIPENIQVTSIQTLKSLSDKIPKPPKKPEYHKQGTYKEFNIDDFISKHNIRISSEEKVNGVRKLYLEQCFFDPQHTGKDAVLFVNDNGAIGYNCFHSSCSNKTWKDVRMLFEPNAYTEKQYLQNRTTEPTEPPRYIEKNEKVENEQKAFKQMHEVENENKNKTVIIKSGFNEIDKKILGFLKGEISVWSGSNGSGKSSILSQLAIESVNLGFKVALFSGELKIERVKDWISLQTAGRKHTQLSNNGVTYWIKKDVSRKIDEWYKNKFWIYLNEKGLSIDTVMSYFEKHIKENPVDVIIVDNLMSLDVSGSGRDKYETQKIVVTALKAFAERHNVHVHFICHPKKSQGFLRKEDVSGTADITNLAANVFMIHRVNKDFEKRAGEYLDTQLLDRLKTTSNVIEIMKNRDNGVSDEFIGVYYETESKRFLNYQNENKVYGWERNDVVDEVEKVFFEDLSEFVDL